VTRFTGPDYGWMWPFPRGVERWYDAWLAELDRTRPSGPPKDSVARDV
jgi:hypothetical protein